VQYAQPPEQRTTIYDREPDAPQVSLLGLVLPEWLRGPSPQFLYLWAPQW